jgi:antitoxin (DNA-binding transcriptional repressor) of toxin-antitoxin stability system
MKRVAIAEASKNRSKFMGAALRGEEVIITKDGSSVILLKLVVLRVWFG